jgi:modulator of FtsH protease
MAYRFQPNPQYRSTAYAASTQSMLGQVLGITALGMCVSALAVYLFPNVGGFSWIAFFGAFILLFAINGTRSNGALSLMLFYAFTFLEGLAIAPIVTHYLHVSDGASIVFNAALTTGLGMFALGAIVYATGLDLRRFSGIFYAALLALIVIGIISIFVHFVSPTIYSWAILVIFSGLVLIDFARIRAGGDGYTPVQMAVQIYLDAVNIFLALLNILGNRRSDD